MKRIMIVIAAACIQAGTYRVSRTVNGEADMHDIEPEGVLTVRLRAIYVEKNSLGVMKPRESFLRFSDLSHHMS